MQLSASYNNTVYSVDSVGLADGESQSVQLNPCGGDHTNRPLPRAPHLCRCAATYCCVRRYCNLWGIYRDIHRILCRTIIIGGNFCIIISALRCNKFLLTAIHTINTRTAPLHAFYRLRHVIVCYHFRNIVIWEQ
jgi:hypothetical protein